MITVTAINGIDNESNFVKGANSTLTWVQAIFNLLQLIWYMVLFVFFMMLIKKS